MVAVHWRLELEHACQPRSCVTPESAPEALPGAAERMASFAVRRGPTFLDVGTLDLSPLLVQVAADRESYDTLVVVGIGGSSLGLRALGEALAPTAFRGRGGAHRVRVLESVDPVELDLLLDEVDLSTTCVHVVTKSGSTVETLANFFYLLGALTEALGEGEAWRRVRVTTDPNEGPLAALARERGLPVFPLPSGIGGRFSVLTPVALFGLAFAGVDVRALVEGAAVQRTRFTAALPGANPSLDLALALCRFYEAGLRDVVFFPYVTRLFPLALWFVQLWAESLGKPRGKGEPLGPTPLPAVGTNDQHAQLQLLIEGAHNKVVLFLAAEEETSPSHPPMAPFPPALGVMRYLENAPLARVRSRSMEGVQAALTELGRPHLTLRAASLSPAAMGELVMLLQCATAWAGFLWDIDPFDQPGVEQAKRYAHAMLGKPGAEALRQRAEGLLRGAANDEGSAI
mgnify:CR=1 FL=1